MTVSECAVATEALSVDAATQQLASDTAPGNAGTVSSSVGQLRAAATLCNAADFDSADASSPLVKRRIFGDATDQAILRFAERLEAGGVAYIRACWQKVFEVPFNSKNKFMIRCFTNSRPEALAHTLSDCSSGHFGGSDL